MSRSSVSCEGVQTMPPKLCPFGALGNLEPTHASRVDCHSLICLQAEDLIELHVASSQYVGEKDILIPGE